MTLVYDEMMTSVLAQRQRACETITAAHHADDTGTYDYTVSILGGKHHGVEIHCRTQESAMWLFDQIVAHRRADKDWSWLDGP